MNLIFRRGLKSKSSRQKCLNIKKNKNKNERHSIEIKLEPTIDLGSR